MFVWFLLYLAIGNAISPEQVVVGFPILLIPNVKTWDKRSAPKHVQERRTRDHQTKFWWAEPTLVRKCTYSTK